MEFLPVPNSDIFYVKKSHRPYNCIHMLAHRLCHLAQNVGSLEILISRMIFASFSTSQSISNPHTARTTDPRSLITHQASGSLSKPQNSPLGSTWHREPKFGESSHDWLPWSYWAWRFQPDCQEMGLESDSCWKVLLFIKLNVVRLWAGILLTSSRSHLRECVAVTKQFTSSCVLVAVKSSLLSTKGPGRLALLGLSSKTTRVQKLSFLLRMVFPDCRNARSSNSIWEVAHLLLKVFGELAASSTSQRSWVLEQWETVLGKQLGVGPNYSSWMTETMNTLSFPFNIKLKKWEPRCLNKLFCVPSTKLRIRDRQIQNRCTLWYNCKTNKGTKLLSGTIKLVK